MKLFTVIEMKTNNQNECYDNWKKYVDIQYKFNEDMQWHSDTHDENIFYLNFNERTI